MTVRVQSQASIPAISHTQIRAGWVVSILLGLFLAADGVGRIAKVDQYEKGTLDAGYLVSQGPWIGAILLVCTALYLVPRTALFGTILLTAYFGGAVATAFRLEDYGPALFAAAFGLLAWIGLTLRDSRIRQLVTS
jgi:hypothetical protein